jgi:hypothetical protein
VSDRLGSFSRGGIGTDGCIVPGELLLLGEDSSKQTCDAEGLVALPKLGRSRLSSVTWTFDLLLVAARAPTSIIDGKEPA